MVDPFDAFAAHCALRLDSEPLYGAPRDVLQLPSESDQYFVVTLSASSGAPPVRLVYVGQLADPTPPAMREVLWWLAGDAWILERVGNALEPWAAHHGYPPADVATRRLFEAHRRQAAALAALLGSAEYRQLLSLYDAQVSPGHRR